MLSAWYRVNAQEILFDHHVMWIQVQLTFEQHRLELYESTYMWIVFNKYSNLVLFVKIKAAQSASHYICIFF